jgi:prevent-host-death family protein
MDTISASDFKATCLALLDRVNETGRPLLITKRGKVVAQLAPPPPSTPNGKWLGCGVGTGKITGDVVAPAANPDEWNVLR